MSSSPSQRVTPAVTERDTPGAIPRMEWPQVSALMDKLWTPDDAPHHSIVATTGGGKTFLIHHGILPLVEYDRVLFIDSKGDDPSARGIGKVVKRLPSATRRAITQSNARSHWYRLSLSENPVVARRQAGEAMATAYKEGRWIVVADETRHLTDARAPGLGLRGLYEQVMLRGRSRRVCMVAGTQAPRWVPSSFYDQPSHVWIGRISDEVAQKRVREVGGISKAHMPQIEGLQKRDFLLVSDSEPQCITSVTKPGTRAGARERV